MVYIVYIGDRLKDEISASFLHTNILQQVVSSKAVDSLLHSYEKSFNGFVAKLTKEEAQKLAGMEGIVSVFPNEKKELCTTRSWDFMGFPNKIIGARYYRSDGKIGEHDFASPRDSEGHVFAFDLTITGAMELASLRNFTSSPSFCSFTLLCVSAFSAVRLL
ncbi:Cucumisin like [Fagus crenata]